MMSGVRGDHNGDRGAARSLSAVSGRGPGLARERGPVVARSPAWQPLGGSGYQMRMLPPAPSESTSSNAERKVFRLLASTQDQEPFALHSLTLTRHEYKAVAEADFVVVSKRGILVLEVKGGGVSCQDGVWVFEDRYGERHRSSEGPFRQVQSAMYALRSRLEDIAPSITEGVLIGFGVLTPDCPLNIDATEWDDETLLDLPRLAGQTDLESGLARLYRYWEARNPSATRLDRERVTRIRQLLRPDFEKVPPLAARSAEIGGRMLTLTENQYSVLDFVRTHPRVLVSGGAGTGKTLLAVEASKREASAGRRAALIVESSVLAAYLERRVPAGVTACDLESLQRAGGPFDVLIVDEAQDLMHGEALECLDAALVGGILEGRWRVFYDFNNQAGIRGRFDEDSFEVLHESASGPPLELSRNCRNTSEIVQMTQVTTGADLGIAKAGKGPPVHFERVQSDEECAAAVAERLGSLVSEEYVNPGTVTILSHE